MGKQRIVHGSKHVDEFIGIEERPAERLQAMLGDQFLGQRSLRGGGIAAEGQMPGTRHLLLDIARSILGHAVGEGAKASLSAFDYLIRNSETETAEVAAEEAVA